MRVLSSAIAWLLFLGIVSSTQAQPGWVKDASDSAASFTVDPDAPALVLHRSIETKIHGNGKSRSKVRLATLILKSTGAEHGVLFEFVTDDRKIDDLKGWRLRSNGRDDKLESERIVYLDATMQAGYYTDAKTLMASFADVKAGDLIAYEYEISKTEPPYSSYQEFTLQQELPVFEVEVRLEKPGDWGLHLGGRNLEPISIDSSDGKYVWRGRRLKYRPDEPLMPPKKYVLRQLEFSAYSPDRNSNKSFATWDDVGRWAWEMSEEATELNPALAELAAALVRSQPGRFDSLAALASYVRDQVRYVAVEVEEGRFMPRAAATTQSLGYGDCKDKATLMRALLKGIEVQSAPLLANLSGNVDPQLPSPIQFDHVALAIPMAEFRESNRPRVAAIDDWVYFDPTDKQHRFGELGRSLLGRTVLRCGGDSSRLVTIPHLDPFQYRTCTAAEVRLRSDLTLGGTIRTTDHLLRACDRRAEVGELPLHKGAEVQQQYLERFLSHPVVSDYNFEDFADSCVTSYEFEAGAYVVQAADLKLLAVDFLFDEASAPTLKGDRIHPFWLGPASKEEVVLTWRLPEGWGVTDSALHLVDSCSCSQYFMDFQAATETLRYHFQRIDQGRSLPPDAAAEVGAYLRTLRRARDTHLTIIAD